MKSLFLHWTDTSYLWNRRKWDFFCLFENENSFLQVFSQMRDSNALDRYIGPNHLLLQVVLYLASHTSIKRGLRSTFWPPKMLQNLSYLWKKKTRVVFFVFHLEQLWVLPYKCPGLCRQILKHVGGSKSWAQTSLFWSVKCLSMEHFRERK